MELGQMVGYRSVSASLDAGLASSTTCLPLGTPLLRKDVGTGPESADIPWPAFAFSLFHHSFFMTPSAHVLYPASLDTSLSPAMTHPPYQDYLSLNLSTNTNVYYWERVNLLTHSCNSQEGISHQVAGEEQTSTD